MGRKKLGIEESRALQGLAAMGGGIASSGGTCGIVIAGVLCLGMVYGKRTPEENDDPNMWRASRSFYKRFLKEVTEGRLDCADITGVDWTDKEQIKAFGRGEGRVKCARDTGRGARILGEVIERYAR